MRRLLVLIFLVALLAGCASQEELRLGAMQHFNRGNDHFAALRYKAAAEEYQKAIALVDEQPAFHFNLGLAYYHLVLYKRAEEAYREAIELDPRFGEAWYNLSLVLDKQDRTDEAFVAYDKYQKLNATKKKAEPEPKPKPKAELLGQGKKGNLPQAPQAPQGSPVPQQNPVPR